MIRPLGPPTHTTRSTDGAHVSPQVAWASGGGRVATAQHASHLQDEWCVCGGQGDLTSVWSRATGYLSFFSLAILNIIMKSFLPVLERDTDDLEKFSD